jgi:hypothetical protein
MIDRTAYGLTLLIVSFLVFDLYAWQKAKKGPLKGEFILTSSLVIFLAVTFVTGIKPLLQSIIYWHTNTTGYDENTLRRTFHNYYNRQYPIYKYIEATIPIEEPILIDSESEPKHFFAYYLAPRHVYRYSKALAKKLNEQDCKYHIVTVKSGASDPLDWSIAVVDPMQNGANIHQQGASAPCV